MASSQSFLDDPAPDVALALAGVAGEEGASVVDFRDPAPQGRVPLHLREHVREEQHLSITRSGDKRVFRTVSVLDHEPRVTHSALAAHPLEIRLPALAVGGVGEHEVELAGGERVIREG